MDLLFTMICSYWSSKCSRCRSRKCTYKRHSPSWTYAMLPGMMASFYRTCWDYDKIISSDHTLDSGTSLFCAYCAKYERLLPGWARIICYPVNYPDIFDFISINVLSSIQCTPLHPEYRKKVWQ